MCTWMMSSKGKDNPHELFEELRRQGEDVVILESGNSGWTFVCVVNKSVRVPEGEEGLKFMRNFLRKKGRGLIKKSCALCEEYKIVGRKACDSPFKSGFIGFVSYDLGFEWIGVDSHVKRDLSFPQAHFVYTDKIYAFRPPSFAKPYTAFSNCHLDCHPAPLSGVRIPACRQAGRFRIPPAPSGLRWAGKSRMTNFTSNLTHPQYLKKILQIKKELFAGETYQVNFSSRFSVPFSGNAFELYKNLTQINPSPFQFFMETPGFAVISNSPERLFRIKNHLIETRPIKGTIPRGKTPQEDKKNIARLLTSEKDSAELAMIIDLERNDLGKLCVPGTVEVSEHRTIEKYSHVIHTVANIRGQLPKKYDWYDVLRALHPGGSITGCPKKRTAEIIDRLEDYARGVYCGTAGYIDLSGDCDFNIMIRTLWLEKKSRDTSGANKIFFHSGGGIVVDSNPEKEYKETLSKSKAILSAIYMSF